MDDDGSYRVPGIDQTAAEVAAHGDGPAAEAMVWAEAVLAGDIITVWPLLDDPLRLAIAQRWIHAQGGHPAVAPYDRDDLVHDLTHPQCVAHPLWPTLCADVLGEFRRDLAGWDADRLGFMSRPRPVGPGYEVVVLGQGTEYRVIDHSQPMVMYPILMHLTDAGWRIARAGADTAPTPGWPPTFPPAHGFYRVDPR
jgi:hypothetical protein